MSYPVLCGAVVLTSANNAIRFTEGATTATTTIPAGTYYLRGNYTTNHLTQSEDFSSWTYVASVGYNAQYGLSPDGSSSYEVFKIGSSSVQSLSRTVATSIASTSCFSIFIRKTSSPTIDFDFVDVTTSTERQFVNVTWSASGRPILSSVVGTGTIYDPQDAGNGWWRIAFSVNNIIPSNTNTIFIYPAGVGTGVGGVELWGAQVNIGSSVKDYVKTVAGVATGPADDFCLALKTAIETATASSNVYDVSVEHSISTSTMHTRLSVTRTSGADNFSLNFADSLTTFDEKLIGFYGETSTVFPSPGTVKASTQACAAAWVGNDVPREMEPVSERVVAVPRAASGRVQGVSRSARMQSWRMGLAFIDERRMLVDRGLTGPWDTLEGFIERFGAGAAFELHLADIASGTTLTPISITTRVGVMHFSEDTLSDFTPARLGPGVPLYSIDLRLHSRV